MEPTLKRYAMKIIFKRKLILRKQQMVMLLVLTSVLGMFVYESFLFQKPYYLVDDPVYTFIDNDNDYIPTVKTCSPYNEPMIETAYVTIDNERYPKVIPLDQDPRYNFTCLNSSHHRPLILLWNRFKGLPIHDINDGRLNSPTCPVTNCEVTKDRTRLNESSYILFHMRAPIDEFPKFRFSRQKWVYVIFESPQNCPMCTRLDGYFNITSTYREDSDITSVYYGESGISWSVNESANFDEVSEKRYRLESKPGAVAALISDCSDLVRRLDYIHELKKYIQVDLYGKCSGVNCPYEGEECRLWLSSKYKFYLALENSACNGYITEKFFNTIKYDVIPVVLGGGDYSRYIPKSGFINILDYPNPADLASYLTYLANNQTAFSAYFSWKRFLRIDDPKPAPRNSYLCEMCIQLHLESHAPNELVRKVFSNHTKFMGMEENCRGVVVDRTHRGELTFNYVKGRHLKMHFY